MRLLYLLLHGITTILIRATARGEQQWIQDTLPLISTLQNPLVTVEASNLSVEEFEERFMMKKPVLIKGAVSDWPAVSLWTKPHVTEMLRGIRLNVKPVTDHATMFPTTPTESRVNDAGEIEQRVRHDGSEWVSKMSLSCTEDVEGGPGCASRQPNPGYVFTDVNEADISFFCLLRITNHCGLTSSVFAAKSGRLPEERDSC